MDQKNPPYSKKNEGDNNLALSDELFCRVLIFAGVIIK
jgi:hypothetical protein